ncbi:hypothetical protein JMUB4039_1432 [Leptotrichia trevisanii]|uniref:hypothetical protein n=1 Tax=Leptotrichia trevisanii TaxID=109328 RepID=UPI00118B745D|nr:hypothetical protein [Leptotrichia trevisanii]BBM57453.1 hypothetical protein JMUB4039_1432 [Leptotrichia trevisanii]
MSINKEDKVLYIIGNGFDLNLGLKTSYNNFFEYTGILTMRKVVEELKKNRNIENYDEVKLSEFIENLKKHILIDENDVYLLELKKNIKMQDTEKIRDSMYSFQRKIFITLKSEKTDNFIDDYGLFIIFLILMETEKDNEWQWVEEKILSYIEELIELLSNNFEETAMYIKNNLIEVEKKIENFINTIVKEKDVKKAKKIFLKNGDKKIYENLLKLFEKKIEKYFKNSQEKSEELKKDIKNIIYKIEYINFILQILFTDFEKKIVFELLNLKIVNINNGEKIDLKEQLHVFENEFGNYVKKINEIAKKIIETDFKYKEIENINDFIEIQKFSLKKMEKIFSNTKESKYVINFNYTDYLDKIAKKVNIIEIKYIHGDVKYTNNTILVNKDNNRSLRFQKTRDKMIVNNIRETLKYLRKFNNIINITKKIQKEIEMTLFLNVFRDKSKILKKLNLEIEINCNNLKKYIKKLYELGQYGLMMEVENSYILKMLNEEIKEKIKQILDYNNTRNITKFNMESILLECKESFEKNIESCTKKINDESVKKNSNIIFGIDKTQIKNFKNELKDFIKSNRRKNMELEWKQLLNEHKFTKIYFYGHSLADADYTFFEDLFNMIDITTNSTTKLIFLYSKGYSYEKNVKKLIGTYYFEKFKSEGKLELIEI